MTKTKQLIVKKASIRTINVNGEDYISITDIAKQKNTAEPKDVVKNWMRLKNTLEYLGLWERLNNTKFKGGRIRPPFERCRKQCIYHEPFSLGRSNRRHWYHYQKWGRRWYLCPKRYRFQICKLGFCRV
jgi:hypothetical protein